MPPYRTTYLLDPTNAWLLPHLQASDITRNSEKYLFSIAQDPAEWPPSDITFILGYTKILPPESLRRSGLNLVVHESALPAGRGFSPVQWQILEGKTTIPVCLIEAAHPVDSGDIFASDSLVLAGHELYPEIREKQAAATIRLVRRFLDEFPTVTRVPQTGAASYYPRRTPEDGALDVNKTIAEQFDLLRIANNEEWPAFFERNGHKYLVKIFPFKD